MTWDRIAATVLFAFVHGATLADDIAVEIRRMTGARTRIVWAHQVQGDVKRWGSGSAEFALMGFDTEAGRSRVILPGPDSFANPSITPDGSRVVFSDVGEGFIYVVDWNGASRTKLASGFALCAWADPLTGVQWVYAAKGEFSAPIFRFQLGDPDSTETVWSQACGPTSGFQVSADGTRAGCVRNHPNAGTIHFQAGRHASHGWGCEAGFAPDNSYRFFHMGEWVEHAGLNMYDADGANKRAIHFGKFPDSPGADAWNPRWSTDVRFLTVSSPNAGPGQDVYLGMFDAGVTRIDHWIRISREAGQDLGAHAWIDPGLGYHIGEAPFSIAIPAPGGGTWTWDYGDGVTQEGSVARHTYDVPGTYALAGQRGKQERKGRVVVTSNAPPRVVAAGIRDARTLQVWFDEPVCLDKATASLDSGVVVEEIASGPTGSDLVLRLAGRMPAQDRLRLEGVFDRAAMHNPAPESILIKRPTWPDDRRDLLFLWGADERERFYYDPRAGRFLKTSLTRDRIARVDRQGGLILHGGRFVAKGAGMGLPIACRKNNAFSIEVVIAAADLAQGTTNQPARILSCDFGEGLQRANVALCQVGARLQLYLYLKTAESAAGVKSIDLCALEQLQSNHVVVTFAGGRLTCYRNGKQIGDVHSLGGALDWRDVPFHTGLNIGGATGGATPWYGRLERIAIFARAIERKEAVANDRDYRKFISSRPGVPRIQMRVKLARKSRIPSEQEIAPYADALVVNEYDVVDVRAGSYRRKTVRVAQWGLIDRQATALKEVAPGAVVDLVLEPFDMHSEVENDPLRDTLDFDVDADLFLDVTVPPADEP